MAAAQQKLIDYINGLPAAARLKALEYQAKIEASATAHPDGMMGALMQEIGSLRLDLLDVLNGAHDIASAHYANLVIDSVRYNGKRL